MIDSVRSRLTLWYVSALAVALGAFSLGVYVLLSRALHDRVDEALRAAVDIATTSLTHDAEEGQTPSDAARSTTAELSRGEQRFAIYDGEGRLLARTPSRHPVDARVPREGAAKDEAAFFTVAEEEDDDDFHRVAVRRVRIPPLDVPFVIVASQSLDDVEDEMESLRDTLLRAVPLAVAVAAVGGWFLARKSLAPVVAMAEQARRMSAESLGGTLEVANPRDELGRLASAFNELLTRLEAAFRQQRQFMADASHELRTPLAAIQTASLVALQEKDREPEEYREALEIVAGQSRRLTRIVEDMFTLARADARHHPLRRSRLDLDELLAEVERAVAVLAAARQVRIESRLVPEASLVGDEDLLRRLVLNLLDNAIKHSPPGAVVDLELTRAGGEYAITVRDRGPGIPEEARARVFERFFRADAGRARAGRPAEPAGPGAGLGLSIARWVAEAHGGRLDLVSSGPEGTTFTATLPAPAV